MVPRPNARPFVEQATATLLDLAGAHEAPVDVVTPALFARSLARAARSALRRPSSIVDASMRLVAGTAAASTASVARSLGQPAEGPMPLDRDKRFADPAWTDNPAYYWLRQHYLLHARFVEELLDAAALDQADDRKARFAAGLIVDALSPTNHLLGNPAALRRAFETGGRSVARGARNFAKDVVRNGGWPSQVDASGHEVGRTMAVTPGQVVYRSELIELIQYSPQTPRVFDIPLLFCPPWINKYYIMDLAPGRSLIEWAVGHGHTCFAISYRNPTAAMRDVGFEDYVHGGPLEAVRVIKEITGSASVNTLSVCLGGTLTAMAMAYNARFLDDSIHTATFINTHTDFTHSGSLGAFTDEATVAGLEQRMLRKGYLEAREMSRTFDLLRANDLVFHYLINNWLMGDTPPSFDLLAWNADSTRMPAHMHARYLRSCFVRNEFARGEFQFEGEALDPGSVKQDLYVLSAKDDHIVPWTSAYRTTQLLGGRSRFVLSTSGHIAGIVNPPSPKSKHWRNSSTPEDPQAWLAGAELREESWWEDWTRWIGRRAGRKVAPPTVLGSREYPPLCAAPGTYVRR
jgi:polyhydroxyalkanoate synthase